MDDPLKVCQGKFPTDHRSGAVTDETATVLPLILMYHKCSKVPDAKSHLKRRIIILLKIMLIFLLVLFLIILLIILILLLAIIILFLLLIMLLLTKKQLRIGSF